MISASKCLFVGFVCRYLGKNTQPWFLYGADLQPQDRISEVSKLPTWWRGARADLQEVQREGPGRGARAPRALRGFRAQSQRFTQAQALLARLRPRCAGALVRGNGSREGLRATLCEGILSPQQIAEVEHRDTFFRCVGSPEIGLMQLCVRWEARRKKLTDQIWDLDPDIVSLVSALACLRVSLVLCRSGMLGLPIQG